jgi:iron complex transport system substrate-binding protein
MCVDSTTPKDDGQKAPQHEDDYASRGLQRLVALAPSATETLYALGHRESVVGLTKYCDFPQEVLEDKSSGRVEVVGEFISHDLNRILSVKPTLVLTCYYEPREVIEKLRAHGVRTMHFYPKSLHEVFEMIDALGEATGRSELARELTSSFRHGLEALRSQTEGLPSVSVYFEIHHDGPIALGSLSPVNEIIRIAGGRNIFEDVTEPSLQPDLREIVARDPEVILTPMWPLADDSEITTLGEIVTRPSFTGTRAVQAGRVIYYDSSLFKRPGPRQMTAIRKLAYLLHPTRFSNPEGSGYPWELGRIHVDAD